MGKSIEEYALEVQRAINLNHNLIYWCSYNILRDDGLVEDAIQEAISKMIKYPYKIDLEKATEARNYICRIVRNASIDIYNKQKKESFLDEHAEELSIMQDTSITSNPERLCLTNEGIQTIADIIMNMDPKYRDPLIYQKINNHSIEEIADIMGVSIRTVHYRIDRAKQLLKIELGKEDNYYEQ